MQKPKLEALKPGDYAYYTYPEERGKAACPVQILEMSKQGVLIKLLGKIKFDGGHMMKPGKIHLCHLNELRRPTAI